MNIVATLSILLAPAICLACFAMLKPHRAILAAMIGLYLFMPQAMISIFGLYEYSKNTSINLIVFLSALAFDYRTLLSYRPSLFDLPVFLFCLTQSAASIMNDLGAYDALSAFKNSSITWIFPYVLGRAFFHSASHVREASYAIYLGGVAYILPCLYEIRMSPQLHAMLYGMHQHSFLQTVRFDGYRPTVFLQHGLMVGMWMTAASLSGIWLWFTNCFKKYPLGYLSHGTVVCLLAVTTVLCKSTGAILLLALGLGILFAIRFVSMRVTALSVLVLIPSYIILRSLNLWSGAELVDAANQISEERGESLQFRINMEEILIEKALQQPWLGWGGWGRSRVYDVETQKDISVTDGAWIIILGSSGFIGLASWLAFSILPQFRFLTIHPTLSWSNPNVAPAAILSTILTLYLIDCLPNCMLMPIYTLCAGALSSFSQQSCWSKAEMDPISDVKAYPKTLTSRRLRPLGDVTKNSSTIDSPTIS